MKAALVLTCVALVLVLFGNWFSREVACRRFNTACNWQAGAIFAYFLAAVFGLVALLRIFS